MHAVGFGLGRFLGGSVGGFCEHAASVERRRNQPDPCRIKRRAIGNEGGKGAVLFGGGDFLGHCPAGDVPTEARRVGFKVGDGINPAKQV